jgi:hypothetical protein
MAPSFSGNRPSFAYVLVDASNAHLRLPLGTDTLAAIAAKNA